MRLIDSLRETKDEPINYTNERFVLNIQKNFDR